MLRRQEDRPLTSIDEREDHALPRLAGGRSHGADGTLLHVWQDLRQSFVSVHDGRHPASRLRDQPMSDSRHVVPDGKGNWKVVKPGAKRASDVLPTQRDAEHRAKQIVSNKGGGEVRIHRPDGRIRDSDTVAPGNDPSQSRDTKH